MRGNFNLIFPGISGVSGENQAETIPFGRFGSARDLVVGVGRHSWAPSASNSIAQVVCAHAHQLFSVLKYYMS